MNQEERLRLYTVELILKQVKEDRKWFKAEIKDLKERVDALENELSDLRPKNYK